MTLEEKQNVKEIADALRERLRGKETLSAGEFATYLGKTRQFVCNSIRARLLPGKKIGGEFVIPVDSVALWEAKISKVREESDY